MLFTPWLRSLKFPSRQTGIARRKKRSIPLSAIECLEDRTLLAVISVGDFTVVAGTPSIDIPVLISGGEDIRGTTLAFSVGDGGPVLGGSETVTIDAVDFIDLGGPLQTIWYHYCLMGGLVVPALNSLSRWRQRKSALLSQLVL